MEKKELAQQDRKTPYVRPTMKDHEPLEIAQSLVLVGSKWFDEPNDPNSA